jgi:glycosyltransferase involved in cell wall biosynthesis
MSLKVLHVVPALGARTGGPAVSVVESSLAVASIQQAIETTIATTDLRGTASNPGDGSVTLDELPAGAASLDLRLYRSRFPRRLAFSPALYRGLSRYLQNYDVVHIHSLWLFPQYAAYRLATRHGIPIVVSPRGALDPWLRTRGRSRKAVTSALWQDGLLRKAALIHVTSVIEGELIADIAPETPRIVVPNGIDWDSFGALPDADAFRQRWLPLKPGPMLLTLGRISAKKGLDILIRAFAASASHSSQPVLVIAGPDDEDLTPVLLALAQAEGVADRVIFTGMLRGMDRLAL